MSQVSACELNTSAVARASEWYVFSCQHPKFFITSSGLSERFSATPPNEAGASLRGGIISILDPPKQDFAQRFPIFQNTKGVFGKNIFRSPRSRNFLTPSPSTQLLHRLFVHKTSSLGNKEMRATQNLRENKLQHCGLVI